MYTIQVNPRLYIISLYALCAASPKISPLHMYKSTYVQYLCKVLVQSLSDYVYV